MKKIFLYLLILVFFASCVKDVDIPLPATVSKLVINTALEANKPIDVAVSQSYSLRDRKYPEPINTATIYLQENGILVDTLIFDTNKQIYKSTFIAKAGNTYKIQGTDPLLKSVDASATVPSLPICNIVKFEDSVSVIENIVNANLTIELSDDINENNYYLLTFQSNDTAIDKQAFIQLLVNNPDLNQQQGSNAATEENYVTQLLFNDKAFNGKTNQYEIKIKDYGTFSSGPIPTPTSSSFKFVLKNITKAYYDYLISLDIYLQNQGNPFSEPVQVYSNINNGFGIMGASANFEKKLR
jgi:hypothetical protein